MGDEEQADLIMVFPLFRTKDIYSKKKSIVIEEGFFFYLVFD
jgi:hypothetical protein